MSLDPYQKLFHENNLKQIQAFEEESSTHLLDFILSQQRDFFQKKGKTLILGCGPARLLFKLQEKFKDHQFYGLDKSEYAIDWLKQNMKAQNVWMGDVLDIKSFNSIKYKCLVDNHLLHFLISDQDREKYLSNIYQHLTRSGLFFLQTMVSDQFSIELKDYFFDSKQAIYWKSKSLEGDQIQLINPLRRIVSTRNLEQEILNFGFKIEYFYYRSDLSILIPGMQNIPQNKWPKVIELVARK